MQAPESVTLSFTKEELVLVGVAVATVLTQSSLAHLRAMANNDGKCGPFEPEHLKLRAVAERIQEKLKEMTG